MVVAGWLNAVILHELYKRISRSNTILSYERNAIRLAKRNSKKYSHNPEVVGSNPAPATKMFQQVRTEKVLACFFVSCSKTNSPDQNFSTNVHG